MIEENNEMTQRVQIRRNYDTSVQTFIGEPGELIYNLTTKRIHAQDGSTPGGNPVALLSELNALSSLSGTQVFRKSGDGVTTTFTFPASITDTAQLSVYHNGIYQQKNGYTATSTAGVTTVIFDTAPLVGTANLEFVVIVAMQFGQSVSSAQNAVYSGALNQVQFTLPVSVINNLNVQVYVGGIYQNKSSFSATGFDLIFSEAPPVGVNNIEVLIINTVSIDSGITAARPVSGMSVGSQFYDTSLKKPIFWDGTTWRDAIGNLA